MRVTIYAGSFVFTLFSTCLNLISLNRLDWCVRGSRSDGM